VDHPADPASTIAPTRLGIPRDPPPLPPRIKRIVLGLVAVTVVAGLTGTALSPYLLVEHPLLLVGLNPDSRHLVLSAANTEMWQVVAVGAPRRAINFLATYGLASVYGYVAVEWVDKQHRWLRQVVALIESLYLRLGTLMVVLLPIYSVAGLAGLARMPLWKFVLAIIPGQVAFVAGIYYFGDSIKSWTIPILAFLSEHLVASTTVAIALVVTQQLYRRWRKERRKPEAASPSPPP
jgi:hypothetical protein